MSDESFTEQTPAADPGARPISESERFVSMDVLRGVAVLGILVINIYVFAMPYMVINNPLLIGGTDALNMGTWLVTHALFEQKFMSIFSMMFGAGMIMMMERANARGAGFGRIFVRRSLWLLVIGALHAYFIWFGDILFNYAAAGIILYMFRNFRPRNLILVAIAMALIPPLLKYGNAQQGKLIKAQASEIELLQAAGEDVSEEQLQILERWAQARVFFEPGEEEIQKDISVYRGDYAGIVKHRAPFVEMMQVTGFLFFNFWRLGALMLVGMAFMKLGIFSGERSSRFYRGLMLSGYGLGLPLTIFSGFDLYASSFDNFHSNSSGMWPNYFGSILVALGHLSVVMLVVKSGFVRGLVNRFAAVGRMALTNYLMHSVVLTTIFYGYGFGLYGSVQRAPLMLFVLAMFGAQLVISPWWLNRYRFGPVEWLWRSLTYWQRQPMKKAAG